MIDKCHSSPVQPRMTYIFIGQEMRADVKSEDPDLSTSSTS